MSDHKSKKSKKEQKKTNRRSSSSESEYEWTDGKNVTKAVETPPDTSKSSTWIGGTQSMEDFLDGFTTVSKSKTKVITSTEKPVNELNPYWKDGGVGFPSTERCDKISKSTKSALTKENEGWLFKSYNSCLEKARSEHVDVETLLLQRWDETTVEAMLRRFGTFHDSRKSRRGYDQCRLRSPVSHSANHPRWRKAQRPQDNETKTEASFATSAPPDIDTACPKPQCRDVNAEEARVEEREVTIDDINAMAAKVLKAELMSDTTKVTKLKNNLEKLREAQLRGLKVRMHVTHRDSHKKMGPGESTVVSLTRLNDRGVEMPVSIPNLPSNLADIKKSKRVLTHDARGERVAFLPEDASTKSLSEVIRDEKFRSSHDMEDEFVRLAAKSGRHVDDEYADAFVPKRSHAERDAYRLKQDAVAAYKRRMFAESSCTVCLERVPKHLVISVGEKVFLTLPEYVSLVPGHCLLVPYEHASSVTRLDDCTRRELIDFKRQIVSMFTKYLNGSGCVFMETATKPDSPRSHTQLECIPVPADILPSLSAYFKKALNELGSEWDQNRRLINLKPQGVGPYGSIPPKFAYFAVEFGLFEGGLARVIDDHRDIPSYFGREIIGEILGKDSRYWRKPKVEKFEALRQKVVQFEAWWEPFNKWSDRDPRNQPSVPVDEPDRIECPSPEGPMLPPDFSL